MASASILIVSMFFIIAFVYIWQAVWIFRDSKKRDDELAWIWCILSIISCPLVLIVYLIFTRCTTRGTSGYKSTDNVYSSTLREKKCSNCGFAAEDGWNYCPNCNYNLQSSPNAVGKGESYMRGQSNRSIGRYVLLFIIGIAVFVGFLIYNIVGIKDSFQHATVPGTTTINLKDSGKYTVFYEYDDEEEKEENNTKVKQLDFTLTSNSTNITIPITKNSGISNYSTNGHGGKSFLEFSIDKPGNYELQANYKDNGESSFTLAIVKDFTKRMLITVLGSIAILFGTIGIGVFIIIRNVSKRY